MINESVKLKGKLDIVVYDQDHKVKEHKKINNLVVASGKDYIAERMTANTTAIMSHMAIGDGNVAPTTSDTQLTGESVRVVLDSTTVTNNTITYVATYGAGVGTGPITEAGIFNDPSANTGIMLCRTNFNVVNKGNADVIVITWNVTVE